MLKYLFFLPFFIPISLKAQKAVYDLLDINQVELDSFYLRTINKTKYLYTSTLSEEPIGYLYFINSTNACLEEFNFNKKTHKTLFCLDDNLRLESVGVYAFTPDSFAFLTSQGILYYNSDGKKLGSSFFKYPMGTKWFEAGKSPLAVVGSHFSFHMYGKKNEREFIFNERNFKVFPIPICYPAKFKDNSGYINDYSRTTYKDNVIIIFNVSSEVFVYNIASKRVMINNTKSIYDKGFVPVLSDDRQEVYNHSVTSGFYHSVLYNPFNDKLYRVYFHPQPLKNELGEYNDPLQNRKASILVSDKSFTINKEIVVHEKFWVLFNLIPAKDGIIVKAYQSIDEYEKFGLKYYYLKI